METAPDSSALIHIEERVLPKKKKRLELQTHRKI